MKTLVIIPAYNEAENIERVVQDLADNAPEVDYVIINDGSKDNTEQICKANGFNIVTLPINLGIGGGVQTGYRYALEHDYDVAIQFDGDGQHMAEYLRDLVEPLKLGQADIAIGSRFIKREGFQSSALRRLGINYLSKLIKILCGVSVKDVTSGMRAANRRMIAFFAANYAQDYPEPEAILASGLKGAKTVEVPVQMRDRIGGVSSINPIRSMYYMIKVSLALVLYRISHKKEVLHNE